MHSQKGDCLSQAVHAHAVFYFCFLTPLHKSGCFLGSVVTHLTWRNHATRLNRSTTSCEWYGQRRKTRRRNILGWQRVTFELGKLQDFGFRWFFECLSWIQCCANDSMLGLLCTNWLAVFSILGFLLECWCYPESLTPKGEMRLLYFMDLYGSFFELNRKRVRSITSQGML